MVDKDFEYKGNGVIKNRYNYKEYNCTDDVDMQILCDDINLMFHSLEFENKRINGKINSIKDILG